MEIQASLLKTGASIEHRHNSHIQPTVDERSAAKPKQENSVAGHAQQTIERLTQKMAAELDSSDKVAEIKAKMAAGTFEIDTTKIANQMIWGERIELMAQHDSAA